MEKILFLYFHCFFGLLLGKTCDSWLSNTYLSLSPGKKTHDTDIWHILVLLLLGFWSDFACGKRIHQDRQAPWSPPSSPPPPSLSLTPNSCQWFPAGRGVAVSLGEEERSAASRLSVVHRPKRIQKKLKLPSSSRPHPTRLFYLFNLWKNP